jgi:CTP:molybdopterin cytidylyltransferase MocA
MCYAAEWVWNLSMIKAVLLAAGASRRVSGVLAVGVPSANTPANGKQGLMPE